MECKNCRYWHELKDGFVDNVCDITHMCNTMSCNNIVNDKDVEHMNICYNCKHWYGMGDWGLSCAKNYYNCSCDGFDKACDQFERKSTT